MKRIVPIILIISILCLCGCSPKDSVQVAATTMPIYDFATRICEGTGVRITRLITENVSCLHDYTLQTSQMRAIESAELVLINGAGLEDFMEDALDKASAVAEASHGLELESGNAHEHDHDHGHVHEEDPHIWLSPKNAKIMADNICRGLSSHYPQWEPQFQRNLQILLTELDALQAYGEEKLASLSCRDLITFHDGFTYLAESFDLHIVKAIEEESGSEASAKELVEMIELVQKHQLTAIFTETNGSVSAAEIIASETGIPIYALDMAMAGDSYFESMYHNIDTLWEALQ